MLRRFLALLACLAIPTLAFAQRGGGGGGGGGGRQRGDPRADWSSLNGGFAGLQLSNRDVEEMSPLKLLIDKRKDLKLTDEQLNGLKDVEQKLKATNEPSFKALDSLRNTMRARNGTPSDDDRERMASARRSVPLVVATIRENYASALKDATGLLTDAQRDDVAKLVDKQSRDADQVLNEKLNARKPGGGDASRPQ